MNVATIIKFLEMHRTPIHIKTTCLMLRWSLSYHHNSSDLSGHGQGTSEGTCGVVGHIMLQDAPPLGALWHCHGGVYSV